VAAAPRLYEPDLVPSRIRRPRYAESAGSYDGRAAFLGSARSSARAARMRRRSTDTACTPAAAHPGALAARKTDGPAAGRRTSYRTVRPRPLTYSGPEPGTPRDRVVQSRRTGAPAPHANRAADRVLRPSLLDRTQRSRSKPPAPWMLFINGEAWLCPPVEGTVRAVPLGPRTRPGRTKPWPSTAFVDDTGSSSVASTMRHRVR